MRAARAAGTAAAAASSGRGLISQSAPRAAARFRCLYARESATARVLGLQVGREQQQAQMRGFSSTRRAGMADAEG